MKLLSVGLLVFFVVENIYLFRQWVEPSHSVSENLESAEDRCALCANANPRVCLQCAKRHQQRLRQRGCTTTDIAQLCGQSDAKAYVDMGEKEASATAEAAATAALAAANASKNRESLQTAAPPDEPEEVDHPMDFEDTTGGVVGLDPIPDSELVPGITLAMHGDISRLAIMLHSRATWDAHVSIAVLVRSAAELLHVEETFERAREDESQYGGTLKWCAYLPPRMTRDEQAQMMGRPMEDNETVSESLWKYPANIMRNRALQLVETKQVMLLDADFIPSLAMRKVATTGVEWLRNKQILIVAPFLLRGSELEWDEITQSGVLNDKRSLISCIEGETSLTSPKPCGGTGLQVGFYPRYLAALVNYSAWWQETGASYPAVNISETEPYYIANTVDHLMFDERYVGYGADKVEQFHRVMCKGRELLVSPDYYIVHAHLASASNSSATPEQVEGTQGNWGEDDNAKMWKKNNIALFNELHAEHRPASLKNHMHIRWRDIYPPVRDQNASRRYL